MAQYDQFYRTAFLLPLALLLAALAGCSGTSTVSNDAGTDSLEDVAAEVDAGPILPNDCTSALPAGFARTRTVCPEMMSDDPMSGALPDDLVLENSHARYIVRTSTADGLFILGSGAGGVVDAHPAVDGVYRSDLDPLQELIPAFGIRTLANPVVSSGSGEDGEAAFIKVSGDLVPLPVIDSVIPGLGPSGVGTITWTLDPDATRLHMFLEVVPDENNAAKATVWLGLFHGGKLKPYMDGLGLDVDLFGATNLLAGVHPSVSLGIYSADPLTVIGTGGLVLAKLATDVANTQETAQAEAYFSIVPGHLSALRSAVGLDSNANATVGVTVANLPDPLPGQLQIEARPQESSVTQIIVYSPDGATALQLPLEDHEIRIGWVGGPTADFQLFEIHGDMDIELSPPPVGTLELSAISSEDEADGVAARVLLYKDGAQLKRTSVGPAAPTFVLVEPGSYSALYTRGHEFEFDQIDNIEVEANDVVFVQGSPERVVDTTGWVACDFHLHSEFSTDSQVHLRQRILEVAAEGVEFAVSTDHDFVTDYSGIRDDLGLAGHLGVANGAEVSDAMHFHAASWPLTIQPDLSGHGTPMWYQKTPDEIFSEMGMLNPARIFQLNHPRGSTGWLNKIKYDPDTGLAEASAKSLKYPDDTPLTGHHFDGIELYNGKRVEDLEEVVTDWLSLIAQGIMPAGTGTSDSHSSGGYPGSARTYVWVGEEPIDDQLEPQIRQSIIEGRAFAVGGAFLDVWLVGPEGDPSHAIREVRHEATDLARVRVRVQAPSWMPAQRLRIYHNRNVVIDMPLESEHGPGAPVIRLDNVFEIPVEGDSFFVARIDGDSPPHPYMNSAPISISGVLLLDADNDGTYTAPGLEP